MGVCIKGMKMPIIEMEWTIRHGADGKWYAIDTNAETSDGEWHEIIPVPPHGDLIGREWLVDIALHLINTAKNDDIANGVKWLWQYIIDAPTVIPVEEDE